MQITSAEYEKMLEWIDAPTTPECGSDGWVPTFKELTTQMVPLYFSFADMHTAAGDAEAKKILTFLLWMSESKKLIDDDTYRFLRGFLKEHLVVEG